MEFVSREDRTWGMLAHLSALIGYSILPILGNFLGPVIVMIVKKNQSWFVEDQAKEALNFQISLLIYALILSPLILIVIGIFLLFFLYIYGLVMIIIAALKANDGNEYRYPFTIRFVK